MKRLSLFLLCAAAAFPALAADPLGGSITGSLAKPGSVALPPFLQPLGPLQTSVRAWYAFNSRDQALVFSSEQISSILSDPVALRDADGQRYADFSASGAVLEFLRPVYLGQSFTLAAWVSFPVNHNGHPVQFFRGRSDDFVKVTPEGTFGSWLAKKTYSYGTTPVPDSGWHHLALSVDGKQSVLYLDGRVYGSLPVPFTDSLAAIGNHNEKKEQGKMMAAGMDDIFIFNRALTDAEVAKVMAVRLAPTTNIKPVSPGFTPSKTGLDKPAVK
jgi:hypothetical protein